MHGTKANLVGQKPPLQPKDVWAIRTRLQLSKQRRDLALFNLAIDSKLRGCDVVNLLRWAIWRRTATRSIALLFDKGRPVGLSGSIN